jgi:hypothetical protein
MASAGAKLSGLSRRARAVDLYRRCLRSAAKCPRHEHRLQMQLYTRMRFDDSRRVQDAALVERLLREGEEELERMDYFHRVREARQAEALATIHACVPGAATHARPGPGPGAGEGSAPAGAAVETAGDSDEAPDAAHGRATAPLWSNAGISTAASGTRAESSSDVAEAAAGHRRGRTPLFRNKAEADAAAAAAAGAASHPSSAPRKRGGSSAADGMPAGLAEQKAAAGSGGGRSPAPAAPQAAQASVWEIYDDADDSDDVAAPSATASAAPAAATPGPAGSGAGGTAAADEPDPLAELLKPKPAYEPTLDVNAGAGSRLSPLHAALLAGSTGSAEATAEHGGMAAAAGAGSARAARHSSSGHKHDRETRAIRAHSAGATSAGGGASGGSFRSQFCPSCGTAFLPAAKFCAQCGSRRM